MKLQFDDQFSIRDTMLSAEEVCEIVRVSRGMAQSGDWDGKPKMIKAPEIDPLLGFSRVRVEPLLNPNKTLSYLLRKFSFISSNRLHASVFFNAPERYRGSTAPVDIRNRHVVVIPIQGVTKKYTEFKHRYRMYLVDYAARKFVNMGKKNGAIFETQITPSYSKYGSGIETKLLANLRVDNDGNLPAVIDGVKEWSFTKRYPSGVLLDVTVNDYKEEIDGDKLLLDFRDPTIGLSMHDRDAVKHFVRPTKPADYWKTISADLSIDLADPDKPMNEMDLAIGMSLLCQ